MWAAMARVNGKLVVVSNRGPYRTETRGGRRRLVRAAGGLVAALDPVLRERGGLWVSAQETDHPQVVQLESDQLPYDLASVKLRRRVQEDFYEGISNAVLWPLLHSMPPTVRVGTAPWESYRIANTAFAEATLSDAPRGARFWIQDYHLMLMPALIRAQRKKARVGWFCHVPWPGPDLFGALPASRELLEGLLGADLLGFHTEGYCRNFLDCVSQLTDYQVDVAAKTVKANGHTVRMLTAPIGVPFADIQQTASDPEVLERSKKIQQAVGGRQIVLGVDRLDYTKGIPERLLAFEHLLSSDRSAANRYVLVQIMVPSRQAVQAYADLKDEIDRMVGDINGRFSVTGRLPVHYYYRNLPKNELYAHYVAADVALITPLRDGMNLVAHEYCAAKTDGTGALVLSQLAGAASYLEGALIVNPHDIEGTAKTLERALEMPVAEQKERMQASRTEVHKLDVHRWADRFLRELEETRR
ncbi:MAG: trehalose-6-phosphate synthase [Sandaracinaceae bacterium]|nr:MAG: trehalose-6-phosphate synthase [Sandaracinaceae bacterium]HBQ15986.1 trehalose-6-phosphate synthase [Myxococcales bacterium]